MPLTEIRGRNVQICMFITVGPMKKAVSGGGEREKAVAEGGVSRLQGMPGIPCSDPICPLSEGDAVSSLWMLTEAGGFVD